MVALQDFLGFAWFEEDVFGDEVVFEYVVRGFLLFDLFLNQVLATTSEAWTGGVRPTRLGE